MYTLTVQIKVDTVEKATALQSALLPVFRRGVIQGNRDVQSEASQEEFNTLLVAISNANAYVEGTNITKSKEK
jgi:hypothetical protein